MKRRDLVSRLEGAGCRLLRHGAKHEVDHNPATGRSEPVPRHTEINELIVKKILKFLAPSIS